MSESPDELLEKFDALVNTPEPGEEISEQITLTITRADGSVYWTGGATLNRIEGESFSADLTFKVEVEA